MVERLELRVERVNFFWLIQPDLFLKSGAKLRKNGESHKKNGLVSKKTQKNLCQFNKNPYLCTR